MRRTPSCRRPWNFWAGKEGISRPKAHTLSSEEVGAVVAGLWEAGERRFFPRYVPEAPLGLPVLRAELPPGLSPRRLERVAGNLRKRGIRRYFTAPAFQDVALPGLSPVDPLPLLRAKGDALALALLEGVPLRERRVAIRGEKADLLACQLATALCPRVGMLLLDFDRGEEDLRDLLRREQGAAAPTLGGGFAPQVSLELSPRPAGEGETLQLWGRPRLAGLTLTVELPLPSDCDPLPLLALLWETGRIPLSGFKVRKSLDRRGENQYNTQ